MTAVKAWNGSAWVAVGGTAGFSGLTPSVFGGTSADAGAVTVVASATPHAVGSWVEAVASSTGAAQAVSVTTRATTGVNATNTSTLLDVGIGAAASEVVVVASLPVGYRGLGATVSVPVPVPSGSRVSVRIRSAVASKSVDLAVTLDTGPTVTAPVALGANTAASRGVILGAPAGPTSPGAWTEIVASTAEAYQALVVSPQGGEDTAMLASGMRFDIATGAAASETLVATSWWGAFTSEYLYAASCPLIPISIPAGTRLSARYSGSSSNLADLILHGVPA